MQVAALRARVRLRVLLRVLRAGRVAARARARDDEHILRHADRQVRPGSERVHLGRVLHADAALLDVSHRGLCLLASGVSIGRAFGTVTVDRCLHSLTSGPNHTSACLRIASGS